MVKWIGGNNNSSVALKAELRIRNLPEDPAVLDLFCGTGQMYESAYKDLAVLYHGVDKEKIHDPEICTLADNLVFLKRENIDQYNVFDLDDYGSPWKQLYLILRKLNRPDATIFITDGIIMRMNVDGQITKFISATEGLPRKTNIPGLNRWYIDIFATMLLDLEKRYGWRVVKAVYFNNGFTHHGITAYYWCLKLEKYFSGDGKQENKDSKKPEF